MELKPCPFCGSEAAATFNTIWGYQVFCTNEDCFMNEILMHGMVTEQVAIDVWNRRLNDVPAVEAVPVAHARWIKEADRDNRWHCSECKFVVGLEHRFYNYCFNCGARMYGERRDSE